MQRQNFYVSAVDDLLRSPVDNPTIGIILCKTQDHTVVEYALRDVNKPIATSPLAVRSLFPSHTQIRACKFCFGVGQLWLTKGMGSAGANPSYGD